MDTTNQSTLPSIPQPTVFIDVYAWLKAIDKHKRPVVEGVFRHALALCSLYTPAYYLAPGETDFNLPTLTTLQEWLKKPIARFLNVTDIANAGCKAWVSLAVDFPAPFLCYKTPFKKVAILHDTLAAEGHFGQAKIDTYTFGGRHNDAFAYVSTYSLHRFCRQQRLLKLNPKAEFIEYGCFHDLNELPVLSGSRNIGRSLSVHSLYRRKNIEDTLAFARYQELHHTHIGHNYDYSEDELFKVNYEKTAFLSAQSDENLHHAYKSVGYFICMSKDEGFSMPPMEAILYGVPTIVLSDIMVHREIYSPYGVNFLPIPFEGPVTHLLRVSEKDRQQIFERFHRAKVMQSLCAYLSEI